MEWIDRKLEGYSRPEKHCEPIQHNWDLYYFTQQQDTNSIQVPIDYKPGNITCYLFIFLIFFKILFYF